MKTISIATIVARSGPEYWEEEASLIAQRQCLCCGVRGHYQRKLTEHIRQNGFDGLAIYADPDGSVWDGHHRVVAAIELGIEEVPVETGQEADERYARDGRVGLEDRDFPFGDVRIDFMQETNGGNP